MDISGLNKAAVLAALYNRAKPQGMGFLHYTPEPMTLDKATQLLENHTYFDYLAGRVMKIAIDGDDIDTWGYNRDNGSNAAENVIALLRASGETDSVESRAAHKENTVQAAAAVKSRILEPSTLEHRSGALVATLGLAEIADVLGPAVDKALE